jgi:hypothetical protein
MGISFTGSLIPVGTFKIKTNIPPVWVTATGSLGEANGGHPFTFNLSATDPENAPLTYSLISGIIPSGLTISGSQIIGTPENIPGTYTFVVRVSDGEGNNDRQFSLQVTNQTPIWTTAGGLLGSVVSGATVNYTLSATDPNNDPITYSIVSGSLPSGITLNSSTGVISGLTTVLGTYNFTVQANDGRGGSVNRAFEFTVNPNYPNTAFLVHPTSLTFADSKNSVLPSASTATYTNGGGYEVMGFNLNNYIRYPNAAGLNISTGDFTVELWFYPRSTGTYRNLAVWKAGSLSPLYFSYHSGYARLWGSSAGGSWDLFNAWGSSSPLPVNQWHHVAISRSSQYYVMHVNGVKTNELTTALNPMASNMGVVLGSYQDTASEFFDGYMREFRVTKGQALYGSGNFTPETNLL